MTSPQAPLRWRSLAEAAGRVDPDAGVEFGPEALAGPPRDAVGRRAALKLLAASAWLAGAGCSRAPRGQIVPYGVQPPEVTPGVPRHYATAMTLDGYATGLVVESHEGRPTKIEGNPDHPASLGATGLFEQASILSLYDPARARGLTRAGAPESWRALTAQLREGRGPGAGMEGVHLLLEPTSSPWIEDLVAELEGLGARAHYHAASSRVAVWEGTRIAFGRPLDPVLDVSRADVIVCLDADLVGHGPFHCRYARQLAGGRRLRGPADPMNRLYVAEPSWTVTGASADHRLRVKARDVVGLAAGLLAEIDAGAAWARPVRALLGPRREPPSSAPWVRAVARDLSAHTGRALVVAGEGQPPVVHALAALLNVALGAVGSTVRYVRPALVGAGTEAHGLGVLARELDAGRVSSLVVLGGNPVYSAPADVHLGDRLRAARRTAYLGAYADETAARCEWLVPRAHYLETWGDARALDGTASIVQPLLAPLFGGRSVPELLGLLLGKAPGRGDEALEVRWRRRGEASAWRAAVQRGVIAGTEAPAEAVEVRADDVVRALSRLPGPGEGLELVTRPDAKVHDGAFANNAWLLELPDPMTKLTWGNAALVSPATAARLGLASEDVVTLSLGGRAVDAPVLVTPGQADDSVTIALGYGRTGDEALGAVGANAYPLLASAGSFASGLTVARTGARHALALTQEQNTMVGRAVSREADLARYREDPASVGPGHEARKTLYLLRPAAEEQWAMSIDQGACTGCSVCVVACQAENNVPVVGEEGVRKGRAMHWLRVDRYFTGPVDDPRVEVEPMACQHCEKAPCEYVCPVGATVHSPDGLNEMVYNRCVGTRFCSNNCPYKVRRFNWFDYNRDLDEPARMRMNPDVTVRARGVMEKCSYCVQRIREAEIHARARGARIADGAVRTACQEACPSEAIVFGSLTDPASAVAVLHADPRSYKVLDEVGTEPRTRYMVRLRNPNPEIAG